VNNNSKYHKIKSIFKRDVDGNFIDGKYSTSEFEYLKNNRWVGTEKIDGTNTRVIWDGKNLTFGGKSDKAQIPDILLKKLTELFKVDKFESMFPPPEDGLPQNIRLYGEGYGSTIQSKMGMKYNPDGVDFILFDVRIGRWWMNRENIINIANGFGLLVVPILFEGTLLEAVERVAAGEVKSSFPNKTFDGFLAEGLVLKPEVELFARNGARVITKVVYKDEKMDDNKSKVKEIVGAYKV